ncbi:MAG: HAD-IA family hydrolase [Bacillota bacterium]|nr:HAD-IA family hydrolase [Bacillota bacterium]
MKGSTRFRAVLFDLSYTLLEPQPGWPRQRWELYPDVIPVLQRLKQQDYLLGVVSNWGRSGRQELKRLGLLPLLDAVLLSGEVSVQKPDPAIFALALAELGTEPEETLMVGDHYEHDIYGAAGAGIMGLLLDRAGTVDLCRYPCPRVRSLQGVALALEKAPQWVPPGQAVTRKGVQPPRPAASVAVVRDGPQGLEVLMGIRAVPGSMMGFAIFPGGTVDPADRQGGGEEEAFLRAAVRECREETGILLQDEIYPMGDLLAPAHLVPRYWTRFFIAPLPGGVSPRPYEAEFKELLWVRPRAYLEEQEAHLLLPTRAVLRRLASFATAGEALAAAKKDGSSWLCPGSPFPTFP